MDEQRGIDLDVSDVTLFATLPQGSGDIAALKNFDDNIYAFTETGRVFKIDVEGAVTELSVQIPFTSFHA